ncbi:MAG: hypothetical protein M1587_11600, partial [Thaumarchaeota archaeon]|nr:hypothetical protein [Nitrososphaerota archaeon]
VREFDFSPAGCVDPAQKNEPSPLRLKNSCALQCIDDTEPELPIPFGAKIGKAVFFEFGRLDAISAA